MGSRLPGLAAGQGGASGAGSGITGAGLQRAVALGPSQRYADNRARFAETETPWVRLWADWARIQPEPGREPDFAALDEDVAAARADGLRVMLTAWRFPPWANGTAGVDEPLFRLRDRVPPGGDPAQRKDLTFKVPDDLTAGGAWGRWVDLLLARYGDRLDALEILNEPNLQMWPQEGIADAVAAMIETAAAVAARRQGAPLLVAPATADVADRPPLNTGYERFTRDVAGRLRARGFKPGERFAWSQHDYGDVEGDRAGADSGVARVRSLLGGGWRLLVTESGARVDRVAARYGLGAGAARLQQAALLERAVRRLLYGPEGDGVEMVCQYLFVTDANYDSGLCDLDGTPRPSYYAWAELPALA